MGRNRSGGCISSGDHILVSNEIVARFHLNGRLFEVVDVTKGGGVEIIDDGCSYIVPREACEKCWE